MKDGQGREIELTSGKPVESENMKVKENGQQDGYVVLSPAERAKGFVRPVRRSYIHRPIPPRYPLRDLTDEEVLRHQGMNYVKYEQYPPEESPLAGRFWTQKQLDRLHCGCVTTMGQTIAETYARDPKFYGATFCVQCREHLPVSEFVWYGTNERVGS